MQYWLKPCLSKLVRLLFLGLLLALQQALAISYTVQVIAVSTEQQTQQLLDQLNADGYKAYSLSVPTPDGPVYRIRVGSFANRDAATKFAEAMTDLSDSSPSPALADGIPLDLVPLELELFSSASLSANNVDVLTWQGEVAIRTQLKNARDEADYNIVDITRFKAWRASPQNNGEIIRVYNEYLWPEAWSIRSRAENEISRISNLNRISEEIGLGVAQLESFQFEASSGRPYLVLVERFSVVSDDAGLLKAIGRPDRDLKNSGPELVWIDQEEIEILDPELIFSANIDAGVQTDFESTEGWKAKAKNSFVEFTTGEPEMTWLAAAGEPIWVRENWMIATFRREALIYKIRQR